MPNLFEKLIDSEVCESPFPHVVINEFFDQQDYSQMSQEFLTGFAISKFQYDLQDHIARQLLKGLKWKDIPEAANYNSSGKKAIMHSYELRKKGGKRGVFQNTAMRVDFKHLDNMEGLHSFKRVRDDWNQIYALILSKFRPYFPKFVRCDDKKFNAIKEVSFARGDVRVNTKVTLPGTTTLGPHVDNENELLAGLIYFKDPSDQSAGGNLDLYKLNDPDADKFMSSDRRVPSELITKVKTIPYESNTAIFC